MKLRGELNGGSSSGTDIIIIILMFGCSTIGFDSWASRKLQSSSSALGQVGLFLVVGGR